MSLPHRIAPGCRVTLHLRLATVDGVELLSTFDESPSSIVMGGGELAHGLELALYGLCSGDRQTLRLSPEQSFGEHRTELLREIPYGGFQEPPEVGQVILFAGEGGEELPGTVVALNGGQVRVDLNHPLAGREVISTVQIIAVEPPTPPSEE